MKIVLTPRQIIRACKAARELSEIVLPYKEARRIVTMKKRLEEELETIGHMEKAMVQEFGGKLELDGQTKFPDNAAAEAFLEKYNPAMDEPVELRLPRLDLSGYASRIRISAAAVEALDNIVTFDAEAGEDG